MGGGIIINRRAAIKTAVNDPSIYGSLPQHCRDRVDDINTKGLADWSEAEERFMAHMIVVSIDA